MSSITLSVFLVDFISKANVFNSLVSETAFSVINT